LQIEYLTVTVFILGFSLFETEQVQRGWATLQGGSNSSPWKRVWKNRRQVNYWQFNFL